MKNKRTRQKKELLIVLSMLFIFATVLIHPAFAQEWFPSRSINVIVPFGAGGTMDVQARHAAPFLEKCLRQKIVVVNKTGGGGLVAFQALSEADPDGLTVEHLSISHSINFALSPNLPFKWDNMTPLGATQATPSVIAVPEKSKYKSLEDLLKDIKKNPGKVRVAVGTLNTVDTQITAALLKSAGLEPKTAVVLVPFKSSGEAGVAVLGNKVECTTSTIYAVLGLLQAGKLKALAITGGNKRLSAFPDVPTFAELGYPEASIYAWRGYIGPPGMPKEIVDKWYKCLQEMKNNSEWRQYWENKGDVILDMNPEEFKEFIGKEIEKFRKVGEELGLVGKKN